MHCTIILYIHLAIRIHDQQLLALFIIHQKAHVRTMQTRSIIVQCHILCHFVDREYSTICKGINFFGTVCYNLHTIIRKVRPPLPHSCKRRYRNEHQQPTQYILFNFHIFLSSNMLHNFSIARPR